MAKHALWITVCAIAVLSLTPAWAEDKEPENRGFLERPPVFIDSDPDFPLAGMGIEMPPPRKIVADFDSAYVRSSSWKQDGITVQPALNATFTTVRVGALAGLTCDWAVGMSVPWKRIAIGGSIDGQPASGARSGLGGVIIGAKHLFKEWGEGERITGTAAIELPTGKSDSGFNQANPVTTSYYGTNRMPLGWQVSSGTWNAYLASAYGKKCGRLAYVMLLAGKIHTSSDQGVKIGNIFTLSGCASYGISRTLAFSLGGTVRSQSDDSYPEAPPPGVGQPALAGTTTHGTTVYLDPSVRLMVLNRVVVGLGFRFPIIDPSSGMVPLGQVSVIFYPSF